MIEDMDQHLVTDDSRRVCGGFESHHVGVDAPNSITPLKLDYNPHMNNIEKFPKKWQEVIQKALDNKKLNVKFCGASDVNVFINFGKTLRSKGVALWQDGKANRTDVCLELAKNMSKKEVIDFLKL